MKNKFVTYAIALKLKELGFDDPCFKFYNHQNELELLPTDYLDECKINTLLESNNDYSYSDDEILHELCTAPFGKMQLIISEKGEYLKHYLGLSDNVTYFAEQLEAKKVSKIIIRLYSNLQQLFRM